MAQDYYYYDGNLTTTPAINFTTAPINNSSNSSSNDPVLLFYGNNQTKQGLGINVGTIDSFMSQWVFVNKFKHAREWRPVSTRNNWANWSLAGASNVVWNRSRKKKYKLIKNKHFILFKILFIFLFSDGYPVNYTYAKYSTSDGYICFLFLMLWVLFNYKKL